MGGRDAGPPPGVVDATHVHRQRVVRIIGKVQHVVDERRFVDGEQVVDLVVNIRISRLQSA